MGFPIERIANFLTGGEEFAERRRRLNDLNTQSHERRLTNRERAELQKLGLSVGRRLWLVRGGIVLLGTGAVTGGLIAVGHPGTLHGTADAPTVAAGIPFIPAESSGHDRADKIREQIRDFETSGPAITRENLTRLHGYVAELYEATFGWKPHPVNLIISSNQDLRRKNIPPKEAPAQYTTFRPEHQVEIYLGDVGSVDPRVPKIVVFRALMMRGFVNAQAKVLPEIGLFIVGDEPFYGSYFRTGFQWQDTNEKSGKNVASFFDSLNTQLIAEYMYDPSGLDDTFRRITGSSVYRQSIAVVVINGAGILGNIYRRLGISIQEAARLRFNSQGKEVLDLIDDKAKGVLLDPKQRLSSLLVRLSPSSSEADRDLQPLKNLAAKLPPIA